jgi:hypothetical protein
MNEPIVAVCIRLPEGGKKTFAYTDNSEMIAAILRLNNTHRVNGRGAFSVHAIEECSIKCAERMYSMLDIQKPEGLEFTCPSCGGSRVEAVYDGVHTCEITRIDEHEDHDYGAYSSNGMIERIQCLHCGHVLSFKDGDDVDYDNLVEWMRTQMQCTVEEQE